MDKKSKIIITLFFISLIASVIMTYKRTMVDKDFYTEGVMIEMEE